MVSLGINGAKRQRLERCARFQASKDAREAARIGEMKGQTAKVSWDGSSGLRAQARASQHGSMSPRVAVTPEYIRRSTQAALQ
jgi:hypothetical protein